MFISGLSQTRSFAVSAVWLKYIFTWPAADFIFDLLLGNCVLPLSHFKMMKRYNSLSHQHKIKSLFINLYFMSPTWLSFSRKRKSLFSLFSRKRKSRKKVILNYVLVLILFQAMTYSWLRCMNWVMLWVLSTLMTLPPSWLPSTSGWTQKTSNYLTMTAEAYSNFMVCYWQSF